MGRPGPAEIACTSAGRLPARPISRIITFEGADSLRHAIRIALISLLASGALPSDSSADEPRQGVPPSDPKALPLSTPIFLDTPADLEAFWKRIDQPDFVILSGEAYRKLRDGSGKAEAPEPAGRASVLSVAAVGEVAGDQARVTVDFRLSLESEAPAWVPLHLAGLPLASIREGGRDLAGRLGQGRTWEVELAGRGEHAVRVELLANVATTVEGRRVDLAIPPAASTRIDLTVPRPVVSASTGPGEEVVVEPTESRTGSRLAARLGPRTRLSMAWRERSDPAADLPVLLSARGEVAVDVVAGSVRSRSSWSIEAVRGVATQVIFRVEPNEEVVDVEVAGQPAPISVRREEGRSSVVVPLGQPLLAGSSRRVVLSTTRPIPPEGASRVALHGYPIEQARIQVGMLAISKSGPLFLNSTVGRGLRRIELTEALRARPDVILAFDFAEQPFELNLAIEPAPPLVRVASRSTVTVGRQSARIDATLRYQVTQGTAYEVRIGLPRGLDFREAGPPELIASTQVIPAGPIAAALSGTTTNRILSLRLSRRATTSESFTLNLRGVASIDVSGVSALPLFEPGADHFETGWAAVVSPRGLTIRLAEGGVGGSPYLPEWGNPPANWVWPISGPPPSDAGVLWLRGEGPVRPIPVASVIRPRSIRHESTITATVDRQSVDVVDEIAGRVSSGSIGQVELRLPPDFPERWEVEGLAVANRKAIGDDQDGSHRFRLDLAQDITEGFRFRVRYRQTFSESATVRRPAEVRIVPIAMVEGTSAGSTLRVASSSAVGIEAEAEGWARQDRPSPSSEVEAPIRLALTTRSASPGPVRLSIRAEEQVPTPSVVASRLWIRTTQRPDFDLATSAFFSVEARDGSIELALPAGSRWVQARVGGVELQGDGVARLAPDLYRLRFPTPWAVGPALVAVEFVVPAESVGSDWPAPRLAAGSVVQTLWEVRLSGQRAGVGIPSGWTDENQWYWDGLLWRRRPARTSAEVANWLTGGNGRFRLGDLFEGGDQGDRHSYLFSRMGPPSPLRFAVYSRSLLVLLCSGPPLLVGLLILGRRPPARSVVAALMLLVFGVTAFSDPSTILLVAQSSLLGLALLAIAAIMNWAVERRSGFRDAPKLGSTPGTVEGQSSLLVPPSLGSDESTAIRPRTLNAGVTTAEHAHIVANPERPAEGPSTQDFRRR